MKRKFALSFNLPKIYTGEGWLRILPLEVQIPRRKEDAFFIESQLNVFGLFVWNFFVMYSVDLGLSAHLDVFGFGVNIYYE